MEVVKFFLGMTVSLTIFTSLIAGNPPYFPIEISRTAATGALSGAILQVGSVALGPILLVSNMLNLITITLWFGLMLLTFMDDVRHHRLHTVGVIMVAISGLLQVYHTKKWQPFVIFCAIYALRGLLKLSAVVLEAGWSGPVYLPSTYFRVAEKGDEIMKKGAVACKYYPFLVITVFKITGVMQWLAFYCLSRCF